MLWRSLKRSSAVAGFFACAVVVIVTSTMVISTWCVHRSGQSRIYDALSEIPTRDVAIVPGVGARHGQINDYLSSRLLAALALYRAHKVKTILMSGIGREEERGDEVVSSRVWLEAHGVAPSHIVTDPAGFRTLDTMQRAARAYRVTNAIICSQPQYLPRSLFLARAAGIDAIGFTAITREQVRGSELRTETLKATLAIVDTYVLHRGPRVTEPIGLVAVAP